MGWGWDRRLASCSKGASSHSFARRGLRLLLLALQGGERRLELRPIPLAQQRFERSDEAVPRAFCLCCVVVCPRASPCTCLTGQQVVHSDASCVGDCVSSGVSCPYGLRNVSAACFSVLASLFWQLLRCVWFVGAFAAPSCQFGCIRLLMAALTMSLMRILLCGLRCNQHGTLKCASRSACSVSSYCRPREYSTSG